jgi:hypothetical integral membrane protein (TIGR02206 family)
LTFRLFGTAHILTLALIGALSAAVAYSCSRLGETGRRRLGWGLAASLIGCATVAYVQIARLGAFGLDWALPLELCHWVLIATVISLFHPNQYTTEIAYFWGLGGTLPALLTPDLGEGFPTWDFALFFWAHGAAIAAIAYLIARGFRLRRGSVLRAFLALNGYALLVGTIDALAGWNYGYLCDKPAHVSFLEFLGPWPWYLLVLEPIALLIFWALSLPFGSRPRRTRA